jgi:hypothetical protein
MATQPASKAGALRAVSLTMTALLLGAGLLTPVALAEDNPNPPHPYPPCWGFSGPYSGWTYLGGGEWACFPEMPILGPISVMHCYSASWTCWFVVVIIGPANPTGIYAEKLVGQTLTEAYDALGGPHPQEVIPGGPQPPVPLPIDPCSIGPVYC